MTQAMNINQAKEYAAQHGINLTAADMVKVSNAQLAERERLAALAVEAPAQGKLSAWVDGFNRLYPRFLEALVSVGDVLLTTSQTVIVAFGVPLVLVLLLIVEHQRVLHGIEMFEVDSHLASFAAAALVITNLVLEFTIHYVELKANYHQATDNRWSLRIWLKNAKYTLGLGDTWQVQALSPAQRYRRLLSLVTFSILALALAGSMRGVIEQQSGAWHIAIEQILTQSTLAEMMTWAGGLLFAGAAVLSAQGLSRYVAMRCTEIIHEMNNRTASNANEDELEQAGAIAIMAIVQEKLNKKAQRPTTPRAGGGQTSAPFGNQVPDLEEEDTTPMTALENAHGGKNITEKL